MEKNQGGKDRIRRQLPRIQFLARKNSRCKAGTRMLFAEWRLSKPRVNDLKTISDVVGGVGDQIEPLLRKGDRTLELFLECEVTP